MKKLITILSVIIFIAVLAYALAFAVNNNQVLALDFLIGQPVSWPASLWLGVALFVGVVVGWASSMVIQTKQKLRIRALTKQLHKATTRVNTVK